MPLFSKHHANTHVSTPHGAVKFLQHQAVDPTDEQTAYLKKVPGFEWKEPKSADPGKGEPEKAKKADKTDGDGAGAGGEGEKKPDGEGEKKVEGEGEKADADGKKAKK